MSEKTAIENLYRMLRNRDVECETYELPDEGMAVSWMGDHGIEWEATAQGENFAIQALQLVTPEQAIAATVGVAREEVATREQESIVCDFLRKISPERDWMYLGEVEHALIDEMVRAIAATVGKDIEHYDGSGRRGTVAILQGGRKPEEVLFIPADGGVTHYLPEGATVGAESCRTVYLVEISDDLIESWHPIGVYLHRESAENCAKALRREEDGIRQFARVVELVVDFDRR